MDRRSFWNAVIRSLVLASWLLAFDTAVADEPKSGALIQTLPKDRTWEVS